MRGSEAESCKAILLFIEVESAMKNAESPDSKVLSAGFGME